MSLSDYPTRRPPPPPPKRLDLSRLKELGQTAALLFGLASGIWLWFAHKIEEQSTDMEVRAAIEAHDNNAKAHMALMDRIAALDLARVRCEAQEKQSVAVWRALLGYVVGSEEKNPMLRAAAAAHYRDVFDQLIWAGKPADEAYRTAVRAGWDDRPRVR